MSTLVINITEFHLFVFPNTKQGTNHLSLPFSIFQGALLSVLMNIDRAFCIVQIDEIDSFSEAIKPF